MTDHEHLRALVSAYFDGELPPADETVVVDHLATCAACQALLGDTVGIFAAVQRGPLRARTPVAQPRSRRPALIAGAVLAVAAAVAVVWKVRPHGVEAPAIALATDRRVEVRFTGGPFANYRPYQVDRGATTHEQWSLAALAALEKRGDLATLAAAKASAGDPAGARELLAKLSPSPTVDADAAAVGLLLHEPEAALGLADRAIAGGVTSARWNRGLALTALGLSLAAAADFDKVVAEGGGWGGEAKQRAQQLRDDFARRRADIAGVVSRGAAMVQGTGPALVAADVAISPVRARVGFVDAVRVATTTTALAALVPLAEALDASAPPDARTAVATLTAARGHDLTARARFADRYRSVVAGTATADDQAGLWRDLIAAGPAVADIAVGVAVLTAVGPERLARLEPLLRDSTDPWFARLLVLERIAADHDRDPARAEAAARDALRSCGPAGGDYRCAHIAYALADLLRERGALEEASSLADRAAVGFARSGDPRWEMMALDRSTNLRRMRGDWSRARAGAEEGLARDPADCASWSASMQLAEIARYQGDIVAARAALPDLLACSVDPAAQALATVVDLALQTGDAIDADRAHRWIEAARPAGDPLVEVSEGRLLSDRDPTRAQTILHEVLARPTLEPAVRTIAYRSLARAEAGTGAWDAIVAGANVEAGRPTTGGCELVLNPDERVMIVAARGPAPGSAIGARFLLGDPDARDLVVPSAIVSALTACPSVAVIARPPLHGRGDLLPAELPWAFASTARPVAPAAPTRAIIVADTEPPPADVRLPRLAPTDFPANATAITGAAATPARVLAELATATYAELHAHGIANLAEPGTSFLALSPDPDGAWQLTAAAVAAAKLTAHPVIVLGACRAAATTPRWDARWSLPDAFLTAGARAVIAADVDLPDREATALFAQLRARLANGELPAAALAAERSAAVVRGQTWAAHLMLFE